MLHMIKSFSDPATADLYSGVPSARVRRFPADVQSRAIDKLAILNAASTLLDLKSPPGNNLEALKGDLAGYHSIRVNSQWRLVFKWDGGAEEVSLIDYH
jgi:proteic killer suppression protein